MTKEVEILVVESGSKPPKLRKTCPILLPRAMKYALDCHFVPRNLGETFPQMTKAYPDTALSSELGRFACASFRNGITNCNSSRANCNALVIANRINVGLAYACSAILRPMENRSFRDAGGTPGGLGNFALGFIMVCVGGYLLVNQVMVVSSYWSFFGGNSFGITLLPMMFGIGLIFWRGRSVIGWILTLAGALFIFAGIIANLQIFFRPLSLFNTIVILAMLAGGLGFIARGVRPHGQQLGE